MFVAIWVSRHFKQSNRCPMLPVYCIQTLTRHSWIHYTDCWIVK